MRKYNILMLLLILTFVVPLGTGNAFYIEDRVDVYEYAPYMYEELKLVDLEELAAQMRDMDRRLYDAQMALPAFELYHISPEMAKRKKMTKGDVIEMIVEVSNVKGVNPAIIMAIARTESHFKTDALSEKGAIGLMQLIPSTAVEVGVDPYNPVENVMGGIDYFIKMRCRFKGYTTLGLAAYNAGPGAIKNLKIPKYKETQKYVKTVLKYYKEYNGSV